jgi:hypothetical protein
MVASPKDHVPVSERGEILRCQCFVFVFGHAFSHAQRIRFAPLDDPAQRPRRHGMLLALIHPPSAGQQLASSSALETRATDTLRSTGRSGAALPHIAQGCLPVSERGEILRCQCFVFVFGHAFSEGSFSASRAMRPTIGCEPAFSRVADPKRSYIFGRCIS